MMKNYNKTISTKVIEYHKNSYNNDLYIKDDEKLNSILRYIMKMDIISLNFHNCIYQALILSKDPIFINSKFLERIDNNILKDLNILKNNNRICFCILKLGHIGSSINSLMKFTHVRGKFPIKRTIKSLVKLGGLEQKLSYQSYYIYLDKLESTSYQKFIRYEYLKDMNKINSSIFTICEKIILSVDNIANLYPYDDIHNKEMVDNVKKLVCSKISR